jgi:hypothetical protein
VNLTRAFTERRAVSVQNRAEEHRDSPMLQSRGVPEDATSTCPSVIALLPQPTLP